MNLVNFDGACAKLFGSQINMPPKRKSRQSATEDEFNDAKADLSPSAIGRSDLGDVRDPWTDEQEALLFKSMISWKPVGSSMLHLLALSTANSFSLLSCAIKACTSTSE